MAPKKQICMLAAVLTAMASVGLCGEPPQNTGEERFMRYRLIQPAIPSVATVSAHANVLGLPDMPVSWGRNPLPGKLSNKGLYIRPGQWSPWRTLPNPPMKGDIGITIRGAEPITSCTVEVQVASWPEEKYVARTMTIANPGGAEVAFTLPDSILDRPDLIETLPETYARRRAVADAVAVPEERRPKLLRLTPFNVLGDPSVPDALAFELETARRLGFNTWNNNIENKHSFAGQYLFAATTNGSAAWWNGLKLSEEDRQRLAFVSVEDEPGWYSGFDPVWAKTREQGFRDYLKEQGVTPEMLGVRSLAEVRHLRRSDYHGRKFPAPVAADAPLPTKRLWHWSCRYTYAACAQHYAEINREIQQRRSDPKSREIPVTVNYQPAGMISGAFGGPNVDVFEGGRLGSVSMQCVEDWMFGGLTNWGKGAYQKVAYFADIERAADRYRGITPSSVMFYPICIGWDPKGEGVARDVPARVNLLLGQGCKTFAFFNYGPTTQATVDLWADSAPIARGVADAAGMVGGSVEPYLWEGLPVDPQACLVYSVENFFWLESAKTQEDEFERQHVYCMLQQNQIPVDIIAGRDLEKFVGRYKAAYVVDRILARRAAEGLRTWVEAGGVLVMGPDSAMRDEFAEPMAVLPSEPGQTRLGKGWVVRFKDREGDLWWNRTVELCGATGWPSAFDKEHAAIVCKPALELAKVGRPVTVDVPHVVADPLVSDKGVAVPIVNLLGLQERNGRRYVNATITLTDGKGIGRAWSSRRGPLKLRRNGPLVSVVMPLEYADVLVFAP